MKIKIKNFFNKWFSFYNIFTYWFISATLFMSPSLISHVFLLEIRYIFYLLFLMCFFLASIKKVKINNQGIDNWVKIFIGGIFIYLGGLIVAAISFGDTLGFHRAALRIVFFGILFFNILYSDDKTIKNCMNLYSNCLVIFSILGIILFFLINAGVQPISQSDIPVYFNKMTRDFSNYLIGLSTSNGFIPILNTYRVQSFYDEPGTFAMALLPGIFWFAIANFNITKCFILIAGLFMTFSVGGWLALILSLGILIFNKYSNKIVHNRIRKTIFIIITLTIIIIVGVSFVLTTFLDISISDSASWMNHYSMSKFNTEEGTSLSSRLQNIQFFINFLKKNPQGIPAPLRPLIEYNVSIGVVKSILEAGWIGLMSYCLILLGLLGMIFWSFSKRKYQSTTLIALALSVFSLIIMSFQREDLFCYYYSIFIVSFFINSYMNRSRNIFNI